MSRTRKKGILHSSPGASIAGGACGGIAAGAVSMLAAGHSWQVWVPLVFCVILLAIALWFGSRAGILGTLLAAAVFAAFLFHPLGSLRVANNLARANLGWMLLIGLGISLLFAPPTAGLRHRSRSAETTEAERRAS